MSGILDRHEFKLNLSYILISIDNTKFNGNSSWLPRLNTRTEGQAGLLRNPANGNVVYCMPRRSNRAIFTLSFNKTQRSVQTQYTFYSRLFT